MKRILMIVMALAMVAGIMFLSPVVSAGVPSLNSSIVSDTIVWDDCPDGCLLPDDTRPPPPPPKQN